MNGPLHYVYRMLATVVLAPVIAIAAPPVARQLSDGPGGATCRHYSVAGKLGWQRPLGDWADAKGVPYGEASFASAATGPIGGDQPVSFDVTSLVRDWVAAKLPNTGMLLRTITGKGIVVFRSRETTDDGGQPVLEIEWGDGTRQKLPPVADTFFDCSTYKSLGEQTTIRVGPAQTGLLVFDLPTNPGKQLERATLVLHPVKHYSGRSRIGVFRTVPAWAVAMPSPEKGIAARYAHDKGIERDPDVIFAAGFEQPGWLSPWQQMTNDTAGTTVLEDRANDFVPLDGKALKATLKKGFKNALNLHYRFARQARSEPEEVFFRYYMRLGNDWSPDIEGGKLPGPAGTYGKGGWGMRKSDGTNGWSVRGGFSKRPKAPDSSGRLTPIGSYVYHADMRGRSGDYWGWNMGPGGLLENSKWYSIEQYLKLNTPGQRDGEYRAWVDGRLVYAKTGLRFRDVDTIKIESIWMNVYHGGTTPSPRDMSLYIDNVVVARRYIGPTTP